MSRRRRLLVLFAVSSLLVLGAVSAAHQGLGPFALRGEPVAQSWEQLSLELRRVSTRGTAHYPVRVKQSFKATWLNRDPALQHIFPLFAPGDTMGRDIRVLVMSQVEPDPILGFEDRQVVGLLRRPSSQWLTRGVLETFRDHGYGFEEDFLLLVEDAPAAD